MDGDDDDEDKPFNPFAPDSFYRRDWNFFHAKKGITFEEPTKSGPMRHTYGPVIPTFVEPLDTMEIFFVKVAQIAGDLEWPLDIYGDVAVRDTWDYMRNYLFRRTREDCQTLTWPQDSLLELTGPTRAVMLLDHPVFEIDLKVKGKGNPSEDKVLGCGMFAYNMGYKEHDSFAMTRTVSSENNTVEVRFAHLSFSLEATISIRLIRGSSNFSVRIAARTASIGEDAVLLDSCGKEMPIDKDGRVSLKRNVAVVEHEGELIINVKAKKLGDTEGSSTSDLNITFPARSALRSEKPFGLGSGSSIFQISVAWSLLP